MPAISLPCRLITYKETRPWAEAIREAVLTHKMPPWKADPHFGKWSNDPRLSDAEVATLSAWVTGSKLEGNPADLPPVPVFNDGWKIGKPDVVIAIPEHKLDSTGPDEYTYVSVPTNFTEDRWIVAAELRPGNRKVVHHAHVFVVDEVGQARRSRACCEVARGGLCESLWIKEGTLEHFAWMRL